MAISALILLLFNSLVPNEISAFSPEEREGLPNLVLVSSSTTNQKDSNNSTSFNAKQIPENAKGPAIPSNGYLVEEIPDGLYWVTDGGHNAMFLVSDDGVIAVDAPPSLGENCIKAIREATDKPIEYVIYSHSHSDYIGAAGNLYLDNVTIVAQDETVKLLKIANDSNLPIPTVTIKDNYNLTLANQTLELDYKDVNYEPGNTYIYAPNQKTLMFVDVIFLGRVPFKDLA